MMRAAAIVALALGAEAFLKPAAPKAATKLAAYVPSGMSPEEYAKLKKREADAKKKKNFGAGGADFLTSPVRIFSHRVRTFFFNASYSALLMPDGT